MPKCVSCQFCRKTSYEYEEYECMAGVSDNELYEYRDGNYGCHKRQSTLVKQADKIREMESEMYEGIAEWYRSIAEEKKRTKAICQSCVNRNEMEYDDGLVLCAKHDKWWYEVEDCGNWRQS